MTEAWHDDTGNSYILPLIVDTPTGKRDISEWATRQILYRYWLCFRKGTTEFNARTTHSMDELKKFTHGQWLNFPDGKYQFIVEKL